MSQAFTTRPVIRARRFAVTSGHYLATAAGFRILDRGGNAFDAAAATALVLALVCPQWNGLGGEVPVLLYSAADRRVYAVSGQGVAPRALTLDWCRRNSVTLLPATGYTSACVPAVVGTWCEVLKRWGTLALADVAAPAIELADAGYPVYPLLRGVLAANASTFRSTFPTTADIYLSRDGGIPAVGEIVRNPDFAATLRRLCDAERAQCGTRVAGIESACDAFYRGPIAHRIVDFITRNPTPDGTGPAARAGLLTVDDFAGWRATVEEPVRLAWRGLDVCKCGPWTQGPVFLQQLALLDGFDLAAMGHNSPDALHAIVECAKLAMADREAYYGDPAFDTVPLDRLLSRDYATVRRALIGDRASQELRPGDVGRGAPDYVTFDVAAQQRSLSTNPKSQIRDPQSGLDTTHLDVADAAGNFVAATPSGGWIPTSPVVAGVGFPLGTRAQIFYLDPRRPNALAPGKRPRTTLTPTLVLRDGAPYMALGTEGGDAQDQWSLHFLLNHEVFGLDLQAAADAPLVESQHAPSSFHPRRGHPAKLMAEGRIPAATIEALRARGHNVEVIGDWVSGQVMCVKRDAGDRLAAAASPKNGVAYAMGW